jgi:hypothetical protein
MSLLGELFACLYYLFWIRWEGSRMNIQCFTWKRLVLDLSLEHILGSSWFGEWLHDVEGLKWELLGWAKCTWYYAWLPSCPSSDTFGVRRGWNTRTLARRWPRHALIEDASVESKNMLFTVGDFLFEQFDLCYQFLCLWGRAVSLQSGCQRDRRESRLGLWEYNNHSHVKI